MGKHSDQEESGNALKIVIIVILLLAIAAAGAFAGWKYFSSKQVIEIDANEVSEENLEEIPEEEPVKQIQIFKGNDRPVACMIDNHSDAWPQFSINRAYAVYEIIVEGGETRLMAVFKGEDAEQVGPMRSSRHYFLDYALENDAIYAHIGWSPQAQSDISKLNVNNINGLEYDTGKSYVQGDVFWRLSSRYAPHNSITSIPAIKQAATTKGYRTTSNETSVLNYSTEEITLESEDSIPATSVTIPFSTLQSVTFSYDEETGRYTRYARKTLQKDATDSSSITTKNIIITKVRNYTLTDPENKGRQGISNIGNDFDGYYITNGKAIPIKASKTDRSSKTVYKDLEGNVINVNDGNTFFEICPIDAAVSIQ